MGINDIGEWNVHRHDRIERHAIGISLPVPDAPSFPGNPGQSPRIAREDHFHGDPFIFSLGGALYISESPAQIAFGKDCSIYAIVARLVVAGTTDTTFRLKKNGTAVTSNPNTTVTFSSGQTYKLLTLSQAIPLIANKSVPTAVNGDYVTVDLTANGTGAQGLSIFCLLR